MTGTTKTINCTSCGAGLDVLGGGRVLTQACGYCGAVLDAQDAYKVLAKYENMKRPASRFRLGDTGVIDGVQVTVIGTKGMEERYAGQVWSWVDHLLFSPTHGYGWLTEEDGHLVFSRKSREVPRPAWISPARVEKSEHRPTAQFKDGRYVYYESGRSVITFLEGEFNWRPKLRDTSDAVSLIGPEGVLTYRANGSEREVEVSRLLPAEVWASFGVTDPPRPRGVHPAQPYEASKNAPFLRKLFGACLAAAFVLVVAMAQLSPPSTQLGRFGFGDIPDKIPFEINDLTRPVQLTLDTNLSNQWGYFEIAVTDPVGTRLFETGRTISFYSGGAGEDAWREGSRASQIVFQPEVAGTYALEVSLEESEFLDRLLGRGTMTVRMQEGYQSFLWLVGAGVVFLLALISTKASYMLHRSRRMSGSDWSDD